MLAYVPNSRAIILNYMRTLVVTHHMKVHQDSLPLLWLIQPNHFLTEREKSKGGKNKILNRGEREGEREREREGGRERGRKRERDKERGREKGRETKREGERGGERVRETKREGEREGGREREREGKS